jgi:DNA-binding NarL/FixJ family response regulator
VIRVLVADDDALVRGGIMMLLSAQAGIAVVGEASTGVEAVATARTTLPDVVLMDLRMPGLDGIAATRALTEDVAERADQLVKVLVLTTFNDDESVYGALRAGASGFLVKENAPALLLTAIRAVADGYDWLDPSVARQVIRALQVTPVSGTSSSSLVQLLTRREKEVLVLMAEGLSNSDICQRLTVSEATVRTHVSRILMKTGSRDRTQAVVLAYQSGLVRVRPG